MREGAPTTRWTADHVARIDAASASSAPVIPVQRRIIDTLDLWDYWPVQRTDGHPAEIMGGTLFIALSAPVLPDPDARHAVARLRLLHRVGTDWRDLGPALPDGLSPGSRQWSGSAIISPDGAMITLYYTAAGFRDEAEISFVQRLFQTRAALSVEHGTIIVSGWTKPTEFLRPDDVHYTSEMTGGGAIGSIKAFRDPAFFHDPANGADYILFAGSLARSRSPWNGAIGIARRTAGNDWQILPPLVDADGLNNELERPHVIVRDGLYYLFWSTQAKVFAPSGPAGPTGLYGMVADTLFGPWRPLNGSGLVFGNPPAAPCQAYSWLVLPDLCVQSFVDLAGLTQPPCHVAQARAHFGGTPAPELRIMLDGERAWLA
ncbi:glycoside hydrolase family 68 protein [Sphingobium sp. HBC34]|uniref:Glycoside hydrolase family 68 protein n=1 Tax=Sphingobium cyanobacteriorum TaxID=3063954 RepID=A0ABT8ZN44_9SPHN|nr:glycoside hydrolase family 68 protein [Sphingobium sp. HBC34]MDO7835626.1 glycoside hydrolase family 68 protein [Sphingobium sp. HBC34]